MEPGELPVGWTIGAGWEREDAERLDSDFEGKYVRGDVVVPVSANPRPHRRVSAMKNSSLSAGYPARFKRPASCHAGGDLVADPSRPRLLSYDQSGLIWDAGVIWRPSPRTELQARVGRRYGGTTFTGSLQHRSTSHSYRSAPRSMTGRQLRPSAVTDLAGVAAPLQHRPQARSRLVGGLGGCVSGTDPGTGACFDDALPVDQQFHLPQPRRQPAFRPARPVELWRRRWLRQRRYFAPPAGNVFVLEWRHRPSYSLSANAGRRLTRPPATISTLMRAGSTAASRAPGPARASASRAATTATCSTSISGECLGGPLQPTRRDFDSTVAFDLLLGLRYNF
jgi:hypothetical protein